MPIKAVVEANAKAKLPVQAGPNYQVLVKVAFDALTAAGIGVVSLNVGIKGKEFADVSLQLETPHPEALGALVECAEALKGWHKPAFLVQKPIPKAAKDLAIKDTADHSMPVKVTDYFPNPPDLS